MKKPADAQFLIHPLLAQRWSPRAFSKEPVELDKIQRLLEAARWAPSCFNEQPWVFILASADRIAAHETLVDCLAEGNRDWARQAPLLMLTFAKLHFDHNGQPNQHARHDIGLAVGNLVVQATAMDLVVHQMAGILPDLIRQEYVVPVEYDPVTALAIGYHGDAQNLSEPLREREQTKRSRKDFSEFVFSGQWGKSSDVF